MTTDQTYDPWDDAASAEAPPLVFLRPDHDGRVALRIGEGPGQGALRRRATPRRGSPHGRRAEHLAAARPARAVYHQRSFIAQSPEWYRYIWPSLKALGLTNPKEAIDKWCKCEQVGTGRTYRNSAGEEKEETVVKFLALYDSEDACRAAYYADTGQVPGNGATDEPIPGFDDAPDPAADDPQRQTARAFIETLAKQHKGDLAAIRKAVVNIPMITQHYPPESEDFAQVVTETLQQ
jgi:hypothetical protein